MIAHGNPTTDGLVAERQRNPGWDGGTSVPMALTAHGNWKFKTSPVHNVKHATPGYCYRCPFGLEYPSCDLKCARDTDPSGRGIASGA